MIHGSDYDERRRRHRRQDTRLLIYALRSIVTTAALVAIAFAFDVPAKIRARLFPLPPATVAHIPREDNAPQNRGREEVEETPKAEFPDELPGDPPRRRSEPQPHPAQGLPLPEHQPSDKVVVPRRPPRPELPRDDHQRAPNPRPVEPDSLFIVLDLDRRLMKHPLADAPADRRQSPKLRILGLKSAEAKSEIEPADGVVADELQVLFPEHSRARILVRTEKSGDRLLLVIEPQMALWAEQPMPFTVKKIKGEAHKARRAADEFVASLAADKQRKTALLDWLKNGRGIPLDQFKQGKLQYQELEKSIKLRESQVETVQQGAAEVGALEQLASSLHDQAELHFELVDSD